MPARPDRPAPPERPALSALPGASSDPGSGPVEPPVLDGLLDDAGPLAAHGDLLRSDRRDLVAALLVPATAQAAAEVRDGLRPGAGGVRIVLAAAGHDPLAGWRAARDALLDVDAVELIGVRLALPAGGDAAGRAHHLLAELDASVPAWIALPAGAATAAVLDVLVADGAENAAIELTGGDPAAIAHVLRQTVDRDLSFRGIGAAGVLGTQRAPGVLNLLCATRAALNGAEPAELAEVLAARDVAPLTSALRRMSGADAAVVRAFLVAVEVPDAVAAAADLARLGLLPPP